MTAGELMLSPSYPLPNQKELTTPVQQGEVGRRWGVRVCEAENILGKDTVRAGSSSTAVGGPPTKRRVLEGSCGEPATPAASPGEEVTHDPSCT